MIQRDDSVTVLGKIALMVDSAGFYARIFETASDGLVISDLETGLVVEANPAACTMYGYAHDEFIGLPPTSSSTPKVFSSSSSTSMQSNLGACQETNRSTCAGTAYSSMWN